MGVLYLFAATQKGLAQNSFVIKGSIVSTDSIPVANASVVLMSPGDHISVFCISKQDGSFVIKINIEKPGDYVVQVSHINYKPAEEKILLNAASGGITDFHFILSPSNGELKEVIVKARLPSITIKQDTIEFNARAFQTPEVIKTEDLLKNITGFAVDNKGRIIYNGKEVEKILIEGDDLAASNYRLVSKYLDASVIDKVQVLNNYEDNRLLKEVGKSGKVAINLTIGENFKNKISGSVESAGSFRRAVMRQVKTSFISHGK